MNSNTRGKPNVECRVLLYIMLHNTTQLHPHISHLIYMCLSRTRSPSPPPSIRLARRTPRASQSSTLPADIITRSPSTATKRASHRHSNSLNTIDTFSASPRTSRPSVNIQTARPTAVTPDIRTVRPTGYRQRIIFEDDRDFVATRSTNHPRRPSSTAATVATPRIPVGNTGALPPTAPEPPRTATTRPPQDRPHRHTWSADIPSSTKKIRSRGEQSTRSAPVAGRGDRHSVPRITAARSDRSDRFSAVVPRRSGDVRRARSVSRGRGREEEGEMEVVYRSRRKGFLGF